MRRIALICLALLAAAYLAAATYLYITQNKAVFPQTVNTIPGPTQAENGPFQPLSLTTPDGTTLNGILFPALAASPTLILAFAGNAHDVVGFATFLHTVFKGQNVAVAGLSYRGYPNVLTPPSTGTPSQQALYADATFIHDTLRKTTGASRVVPIGFSLGTSVATYLATVRPVSNLILIAPPASIRRLAEEKYPWLPVRALLRNPFPTEDLLRHVTAPTTIFYGPNDGLVPPAHITQILHNALPTATLIPLPGPKHGDLPYHPALPASLRQALAISQ